MSIRIPSLVVLGFPKCGTSALMRELGGRKGVKTIYAADGTLELVWPAIKGIETELFFGEATVEGARLILHKYTAYIYSPTAIRYLAENPDRKFVVCIRDPAKSLVSWWNMHKKIAETGRVKDHFAFEESEFYKNCTVEEYYEKTAKRMLDYGELIQRTIRLVGPDRITFVSQERMSRDIRAVADELIMFATGLGESVNAAVGHVSYAERSKVSVDQAILDELRAVYGEALVAASSSGAKTII